ncbi:SJCHGC02328 protein, related [Eimeria maxima]|uniref:SJCHGC02328 protein, related n=1 Tax=Eimeria maxima TaxID=5804 RepID=U6M1H3_EIMMA|nr:SJCHGC02328 protein, related [Eimeria maxima]CDJ58047.1 SJCHGC02328 protein, related [Eimeria maxima]
MVQEAKPLQQEGTEGAPEGPQEDLGEAEKLFDRQIRLWGLEAQKKLMSSRVLFIGMSAINVEASKDLALAGVSQTICDSRQWTEEEAEYNFLPVLANSIEPNCTVAEASKKGLEAMASFIPFSSALHRMSQGGGWFNRLAMLRVHRLLCAGLRIQTDNGAKSMFSHPHLLGVLQAKLGELDPKVNPAIFAVLALLRVDATAGVPRPPNDTFTPAAAVASKGAAAAESEETESATEAATRLAVEKVLTSEGLKVTSALRFAARQLAIGFNQQVNTSAAIVGGLLTQEVRKYITRDRKAVPNVVVFDAFTSCAAVARRRGARDLACL